MDIREDRYYTPEEYLAFEETALEKHEYYDGRIYEMPGSSVRHAYISSNVLAALHPQLRGRQCELFISQVKVHVEASGLYTYPDMSALRGDAHFESEEHAILLNPTMLLEILSPSTEGYDRGEKFNHYRRLPSLREYVLVSQDRARVERFARPDASAEWTMLTVDGLDAAVELPSIGCVLRLRDVYEDVSLPLRPPLRPEYEACA